MENLLLKFEESREANNKFLKYIPSCFVICPLPVRSTGPEKNCYERKYSYFDLKIIGSYGIPGGKIARNILMLFTTEVIYKKGIEDYEEINLHYNSYNDFVRSTGKNQYNYNNKILIMLEKISACNITFIVNKKEIIKEDKNLLFINENVNEETKNKYLNYKNLINIPIVEKMKRIDLISEKEKERTKPISIDIKLSKQFIEAVKNNAVPVDFNVYNDIRSSLMSDLYVWLIYRNNGYIDENGLFISRKNLLEQFGEDNIENEREKYFRIIESVKEIKKNYFKELKLIIIERGNNEKKGIVLYKSNVRINRDDIKYIPVMKV